MTSQDILLNEEADLLLFLADELDPQQRAVLEARLQAEPALRERFAVMQSVDTRLASVQSVSVSSAFVSERALKSSLRLVREQVLLRNQKLSAPRGFRVPPYAIAAGIAIVFTLGFIGWLYTTPPVNVTAAPVLANNTNANTQGGFAPGTFGPGSGGFLTGAFSPIGVDQYGDASRRIDQEIDALSMLADFEEGQDSN